MSLKVGLRQKARRLRWFYSVGSPWLIKVDEESSQRVVFFHSNLYTQRVVLNSPSGSLSKQNND